MKSILLRYGAMGAFAAIVVGAIAAGLLIGGQGAVAALIGGGLAGLNFIGLIYTVSTMFDSETPGAKKATLGLLLVLKFGFVAAAFYWALVLAKYDALGITIGIGAAIFGLTVGLTRATSSPEGKAAMAAESKRIEELMQEDADDAGP